MLNLTKEQRELRNKVEEQKNKIEEAELQIREYQKVCSHEFTNYENPHVEVKYCVICGFETWK